MKYSIIMTFVAAGLVVLGACKDDHEHGDGHEHLSPYPACDEIIEACHPVDVAQGGLVSDCHVMAHEATSEEPCLPKKDECLRACEAAAAAFDAGTFETGAPADASDQ